MTVTMTRSAGTRAARPPVQRFTWPGALALHLLPVAVAFAAAALLRALDVPPRPAAALAVVFVLLPAQLGLLLHAAHRATGRWSVAALPAVLGLPRRLPPRRYLMLLPSLGAIGLGVAMLLGVEQRSAWLLLVAGAQEVYCRGYLLPRLPVSGAPAVLVSAGLSALPFALPFALSGSFAFVLVMHVVVAAVTVRLDSVRAGVAAHCVLALALLAA
ncbi:CPBP family glutamic-type intramembrane protease [Dactylosporangium sp. NPDC050688]|uniref:CPBP family glutamic-type intramembrane protease n=1 Tax=Dactylosporangium sp. NPDC050688 TaxID=3157217 RepID=UPI0033F96711